MILKYNKSCLRNKYLMFQFNDFSRTDFYLRSHIVIKKCMIIDFPIDFE